MSVALYVLLKPVIDNIQLRFSPMGEPALTNAGLMMNPFDEFALEAALTVKEGLLQAGETEVTLTGISLALPAARETLKKAIAVGADAGILITDPTFDCCPVGSPESPIRRAQILAKLFQMLSPAKNTAILCGQSALDSATGATGVLLAEALGTKALTGCRTMTVNTDQTLNINLEMPDGSERYLLDLKTGPWILSCAKGVQDLRTANIKGVMRANKTEVKTYALADLGLSPAEVGPDSFGFSVENRLAPPAKAAGRMLNSNSSPTELAKELVAALKELA